MEPQDNKLVAVRKAISAHEEAMATLNDLLKDGSNPMVTAMLGRIQQNLDELHRESAVSDPADTV
jgi:hypothetical protein